MKRPLPTYVFCSKTASSGLLDPSKMGYMTVELEQANIDQGFVHLQPSPNPVDAASASPRRTLPMSPDIETVPV